MSIATQGRNSRLTGKTKGLIVASWTSRYHLPTCMYAHLPKPCAGHRSVLQVVISAIFQDRRGFVNDGTITSYQTRQNPEIQKILGFLLDVAKRQRGPGHHTKQGTNGRTGLHERSGGNGSGKTPGQGVVPVYPAEMLDIPELVLASRFRDICQLSKCGHCGGLKNRWTWFDPGSWHQFYSTIAQR